MNHFEKIELWHWRQFDKVSLDLNVPLCVLTGPNGCGKTTILNVLGRHFGWNINFVSTPYLSTRKEKKFWSDVYQQRNLESSDQSSSVNVGNITYTSQEMCALNAPSTSDAHQYSLIYGNQRPVEGLHIPSHRPVTSYVPIETIPVNPKTSQQQFLDFQQLLFQTYGGANTRNPGTILKQSLIALALFGYGNEYVTPNPEYRRLFDEFQRVLIALLPKSIRFIRLEVRMPDIILVTETGEFPLDAMSGGISAILGMAWQIHMYGVDKQGCTVIIDEPENHLHPSMQREFLPSLVRAFPTYRFIISTHSPFVAASSPEAFVYALMFNKMGRIESHRLDDVDLAGSPNKILREVLDVPTTSPIWVENRILQILQKYEGAQSSEETAEKIFSELKEAGLDSAIGGFFLKDSK